MQPIFCWYLNFLVIFAICLKSPPTLLDLSTYSTSSGLGDRESTRRRDLCLREQTHTFDGAARTFPVQPHTWLHGRTLHGGVVMGRGEEATARQLLPIKNTPVEIEKQVRHLFLSGLVWAARFYPVAPKTVVWAQPGRGKEPAPFLTPS